MKKPSLKKHFHIEEIFNQYKDKVFRLAISITRNKSDAEDILQNTFLKIMKHIRNFKSKSGISTWIYKITYNEALMHLRKRYRQPVSSDNLEYPQVQTTQGLFINWAKLPDEQLLDEEFKQRLDAAIKDMPIKYRMPLLLHNVESLSVKDSARVLGLKENSLKTRLRRSRMIINSQIQNYIKDQKEKKARAPRSCGIMVGFIYDYADRRLDNKSQNAFNRHIDDCPGCKSFLKTYLKAIKITKALECQDLPEELQAKIKTFLLIPQNR